MIQSHLNLTLDPFQIISGNAITTLFSVYLGFKQVERAEKNFIYLDFFFFEIYEHLWSTRILQYKCIGRRLKSYITLVAFWFGSLGKIKVSEKGNLKKLSVTFISYFFIYFERERNAGKLYMVGTKRSEKHWVKCDFPEKAAQNHFHILVLVRLFRWDGLISR